MGYGADIMTARTQITLDRSLLRRARERAGQLGISLTEYVRRLVARDLAAPRPDVDPSLVFDLGASDGSDVATTKDRMIADALSTGQQRE